LLQPNRIAEKELTSIFKRQRVLPPFGNVASGNQQTCVQHHQRSAVLTCDNMPLDREGLQSKFTCPPQIKGALTGRNKLNAGLGMDDCLCRRLRRLDAMAAPQAGGADLTRQFLFRRVSTECQARAQE
jgi:hypothetical protein